MIPSCILEQICRDAEADRKFRASLGLPPVPQRQLPERTWKDEAEELGVAFLMLAPLLFTMCFAGGFVWAVVLVVNAVTGAKIELP